MNLLPQFLYSHILEDPITTLESKITKNKFQILQIQPNKYQEYYILQSQKKECRFGDQEAWIWIAYQTAILSLSFIT